uniref:Uncharacterized protein n=1 Tax=Ditylenchus dipsaci TaxID=166011 RepID=A0A915DEX2_9BILA
MSHMLHRFVNFGLVSLVMMFSLLYSSASQMVVHALDVQADILKWMTAYQHSRLILLDLKTMTWITRNLIVRQPIRDDHSVHLLNGLVHDAYMSNCDKVLRAERFDRIKLTTVLEKFVKQMTEEDINEVHADGDVRLLTKKAKRLWVFVSLS